MVVRDAGQWGPLDQLPGSFRRRMADRLYSGMANGFRVHYTTVLLFFTALIHTWYRICHARCTFSIYCFHTIN